MVLTIRSTPGFHPGFPPIFLDRRSTESTFPCFAAPVSKPARSFSVWMAGLVGWLVGWLVGFFVFLGCKKPSQKKIVLTKSPLKNRPNLEHQKKGNPGWSPLRTTHFSLVNRSVFRVSKTSLWRLRAPIPRWKSGSQRIVMFFKVGYLGKE